MRWPIRHQILVPFATVVVLAIAALTALAVLMAARSSERQTLARLQSTIDTLSHTSFPYTAPVLEKLRGLSGAHFLGCGEAGNVVVSTLPAGTRLPDELFSTA